MTGVPVLAIAITILAITGVTLINNSRKGDVKEVLRAELKSHRAETETGFVQLEARMAPRFNSMDRRLDEPLRIVGEHETGIARIEERPR